MRKSQNILVSPLNWGLGHATRLIPIIEWCLKNNKNVFILGNGEAFKLLCQRFPDCKNIYLSAPKMRYGKKTTINFHYVLSAILLAFNVFVERCKVSKIIRTYNIDTIISDNRPGVFSKQVKSIYISHQINVFTRERNNLVSKILTILHKKVIKKYDACWVPDNSKSELTGRMSENVNNLNLNYIGILSRFQNMENFTAQQDLKTYEIVAIVSGPETQRSIFEKIIFEKLLEENRKSLIIRGLPKDSKCVENKDNIDFLNHCSDSEFFHYISNAKIIICRSGYSSIMDMLVFNKNVIIIPTPGQPEQEYLAKRLNNKYNFVSLQQEDLKNICLSQIDFQTKQSFENCTNELYEFLNLHL